MIRVPQINNPLLPIDPVIYYQKCSLTSTDAIKNRMSMKMQKLRKNLIQINNGYLMKHQTFIKDTFRTLPYLVNKKLKPMKKQPEFIKNQKVLNENMDAGRNGIEYSLMKTCQIENWYSMQNQTIRSKPNCRYLYHKVVLI